jgi:hypothetical protein
MKNISCLLAGSPWQTRSWKFPCSVQVMAEKLWKTRLLLFVQILQQSKIIISMKEGTCNCDLKASRIAWGWTMLTGTCRCRRVCWLELADVEESPACLCKSNLSDHGGALNITRERKHLQTMAHQRFDRRNVSPFDQSIQ